MPTIAKKLALLLFLVLVVAYFGGRFPEAYKGSDFPAFYVGARMVHDGLGHRLFEPELQRQYQVRFLSGAGPYYIHPPFETLLYLPFSLLSLPRAYWLWSLCNGILLVLIARWLAKDLAPRLDWPALFALLFLFVPVLLNFVQGQDSALLLFFFVLAFAALKRNRDFAAGCLLACGLFKFHLVLPLALILTFRRSGKFLNGFAAVGVLLAAISVAISGWGVFASYLKFMAYLEATPAAANYPSGMATLHGLASVLLPASANRALIIGSSLLTLALALHGWLRTRAGSTTQQNLAFANAMLAAVLAGYHLSPHDLTLLLLPMALILNYVVNTPRMPGWLRISLLANLALLFLPPMHLWVLHLHMYAYAGVAVLTLFLLTYTEISRTRFHEQPS